MNLNLLLIATAEDRELGQLRSRCFDSLKVNHIFQALFTSTCYQLTRKRAYKGSSELQVSFVQLYWLNQLLLLERYFSVGTNHQFIQLHSRDRQLTVVRNANGDQYSGLRSSNVAFKAQCQMKTVGTMRVCDDKSIVMVSW